MANLKDETLQILVEHGKTIDDVRWAGSKEYTIPLDNFWEKADTEYDNGYGAPEIFGDLLVVGDDFWLERNEYDGSEWWEYKAFPAKPNESRRVKTLSYDYWYEDHHPEKIFEEEQP